MIDWMRKPKHPLVLAAEADMVLARASHQSQTVHARLEDLERRHQQLEESHPVIDVIAHRTNRTDPHDA